MSENSCDMQTVGSGLVLSRYIITAGVHCFLYVHLHPNLHFHVQRNVGISTGILVYIDVHRLLLYMHCCW